jgi:hypothetical protein
MGPAFGIGLGIFAFDLVTMVGAAAFLPLPFPFALPDLPISVIAVLAWRARPSTWVKAALIAGFAHALFLTTPIASEPLMLLLLGHAVYRARQALPIPPRFAIPSLTLVAALVIGTLRGALLSWQHGTPLPVSGPEIVSLAVFTALAAAAVDASLPARAKHRWLQMGVS